MQKVMHVATGHIVDATQLPGLDHPIYAHGLPSLIEKTDYVWQGVSRAFPVLLGPGDRLLNLFRQSRARACRRR
jgi:hypothetical protein